MINVLRLIYINLLGIFNLNEIMVARNDGVKSSRENKTVVILLAFFCYGYILYSLFDKCNFFEMKDVLVLGISFGMVACFLYDFFSMTAILFKENDLMLLSFPLNKTQVVVSKLATLYFKNLVLVFLFALSSFIVYLERSVLTEELLTVYFICVLLVPVVPILLSCVFSYFVNYVKIYYSKFLSILLKFVGSFVLLICLYFVFGNMKYDSLASLFSEFIQRFGFFYFPLSFFKKAIYLNLFSFVLLLLFHVFVLVLFLFTVSNDYLKMGSILSGVKRKKVFTYKKSFNLKKRFGLVRKEFLNLINNKTLFYNSVVVTFLLSVCLVFLLLMLDVSTLKNTDNFEYYFNYYVPSLMGILVVVGNFAASSISLEKDYFSILKCYPIRRIDFFLGKFILCFIIGSFFALVNSFAVWYFFRPRLLVSVLNFLLPVGALLFNTILSLVLDYRFREVINLNNSYIVKQRLITMVPAFISIFMALFPILFQFYGRYFYLMFAYLLIYILGSVILIFYLILYLKKEKKVEK